MGLNFKVQGEFITQLAREKCHKEGKFDYAIDLLMSCLETDEISKEEIRHMAIDILDGRAEIRGVYPGEDYGLFYLDTPDNKWSLGETLENTISDLEKTKEEMRGWIEKFNFISERLSEWERREANKDYYEMTDEALYSDIAVVDNSFGSSLLNSFIKRMQSDTEDDYGWLEPNGTFHAVEWGEHQSWAMDFVEKMEPNWQDKVPITQLCDYAGDYLTSRGWILLHNPAQGIAKITKDESKPMTKAQQDFLYGYYIDRDCHEEANAIMQEDDYEY